MHVFFDIHMRLGHDGLRALLLQEKKGELKDGETALFINHSWTALKMLTASDVILHLKRPDHKPINPEAIHYLPNCVQGGTLDYTKALSETIRRKLGTSLEAQRAAKREAAAARRKALKPKTSKKRKVKA